MGLVIADVNRDGRADVIAGSFLYLNPGPDLAGVWKRIRLGNDVDAYFAIDVAGDPFLEVVGARKGSLLWLKAANPAGDTWTERVIGETPAARTQGYIAAQVEPGGREELVFTRGHTLSYLQVPDHPEQGPWPHVVISTDASEEGVAAADIDHDGDLDLVTTGKDGHDVLWFENPGTAGAWKPHSIGSGGATDRWLDRVAIADINHDGRLDVVVTEETQDWTYNALVYWFEAPEDGRSGAWQRHTIATLRSANSLDVRDVDGDGLPDVILAEHTDMRDSSGAPNNLTVIYRNTGSGASWSPQPIEVGPHSSHLGAHTVDLDGDGRLDIVSLAWNQFNSLHLWWHRSN
jgi:hypothetical protein